MLAGTRSVLSISPISNFSCCRNRALFASHLAIILAHDRIRPDEEYRAAPESSSLLPRSGPGDWHSRVRCRRKSPARQQLVLPAARPSCGDGNDNTSVALSFPRNRRLRDRNSWLFVTNTFTVSRKWTARLARRTKRSSVDGLNPVIFFRRITNLSLHAIAISPARLQRGLLFCRSFWPSRIL